RGAPGRGSYESQWSIGARERGLSDGFAYSGARPQIDTPVAACESRAVAIRVRRPSDEERAELLEQCRADDLTYEPTGGSLGGPTPPQLTRRRWVTALDGHEAFDRGVAAISDWAVHRGAGLAVVTDGPVAVGTNVVLVAPLPVGFVDATCRIVAVVDEAN